MSKKNTDEELIELSQLRWHCRRGVKELDVILSNYLDNHYLDSAPEIKDAFKTLLKIEDPILMDLVMGHIQIDDQRQNQVLGKMKNSYAN